jgi:predicted O-methyltransferase YrrM
MSRPEKLNVFIGVPSYGGNGGIASEHPDVRDWLIRTIVEMKSDPRIGKVVWHTANDTPITMVRNDFVELAREQDCQVLVMVDSDMSPDLYLGVDPNAKPFWKSSFELLWDHYEKGPVVIGAPYCGPPPHPTKGGQENIYVFLWASMEAPTFGGRLFATPTLNQYSRAHANMMSGIQTCAALPTGLIAYDMRCFDHIEYPYFEYEYTDKKNRRKASTEDVYNTRNISLAIQLKLGYSACFCNWDAWAGHHKPKCVGRPFTLDVDSIADNLRQAVDEGVSGRERLVNMNCGGQDDPTESAEQEWARSQGNAHGVEFPQGEWETLSLLLREIANRKPGQLLKIVEVGTWVGNTAVRMSDYLDSLGRHDHIILCVDTFKGNRADQTSVIAQKNGGSMLEAFKANTAHKPNNIFPIVADSLAAVSKVPDECDLIFIDADHQFEAVAADIATYWPKVRPGGVLVGHDYSDAFPECKGAWEDVIVCRWQTPLDSNEGVCWVFKQPVEELVGAEG